MNKGETSVETSVSGWHTSVGVTLPSDSPDNEFDNVSSVFDDCDGIRVEHAFCRVAVYLQELITHLAVCVCVCARGIIFLTVSPLSPLSLPLPPLFLSLTHTHTHTHTP